MRIDLKSALHRLPHFTRYTKADRYTTIVFDLGNTLIRFDHNIATRKLSLRFGINPRAAYDLFFDSEITHLFEKGLISPAEFHSRATALLGIDMPYEEFAELWNNIFWEDKEACAIARRLKRSYRLFLLSNVNKSHFEYIRDRFDIIGIFDEVIASFMVGLMKPDRRIFEDVIRRSGGEKKSIVYIDDREDLITEARALGIDSIRFESADKLKAELKNRGILS